MISSGTISHQTWSPFRSHNYTNSTWFSGLAKTIFGKICNRPRTKALPKLFIERPNLIHTMSSVYTDENIHPVLLQQTAEVWELVTVETIRIECHYSERARRTRCHILIAPDNSVTHCRGLSSKYRRQRDHITTKMHKSI